ncbi:MAG: L-aspartate oxidase [Bryobacterales bacterium]|nr:L-aspartate oxidase [Bryobacterales bacterium]
MNPDFLVIGAGVAGLRAAIELASAGQVLVLAKDEWKESSSEYAQGGIAAALNDDDEVGLHEQDTLAAGDGLCNRAAVRALVEEGPHAIEELLEWGAAFDREGTKLLFAREGAHSRSRVLHAYGDSTGREILRTLWQKVSSNESVRILSFTAITELLRHEGAIAGAVAFDSWAGGLVAISSKATLLATGGLGRVYEATTNPNVATGDGVALAYRAGVEISDIEFVQFHPTALRLEGAPCFLLSEALRGEGAYLRNQQGDRFMHAYSDMQELAPRDVVSRSMVREMIRTGTSSIQLDLTHMPAGFVASRFPRIYETCLRYGIDLERQAAPVHPAAHYAMGGVRTDIHGRTSAERLFAAGEVACTGVHGANRLASNSLLEGLVYGARAGRAMRELAAAERLKPEPVGKSRFPLMEEEALRRLAWEKLGIIRSGESLREALSQLHNGITEDRDISTRQQYELRNMHRVAELIARSALAREESRGAHRRTDFPETRKEFEKHSVVRYGRDEVEFGY